jgi:hypothetical protein
MDTLGVIWDWSLVKRLSEVKSDLDQSRSQSMPVRGLCCNLKFRPYHRIGPDTKPI